MPEYIQLTKNGPGPRLKLPPLGNNAPETVGLSSPWEPSYDKNLRPEFNQE